ncbi:MAG: hypothetical protein VYD71_02120 [Bacteroidota bacterium]|nr:hypothetical protein [Bacteroidota bacterium]
MSIFLKILVVVSLSSVKFLFAIPLSIIRYDFNFLQTFLYSVIGGVIGVFIASYVSEKISKFFTSKSKRKKRGVRKKIAIKTARKYGLFGITFLTPIFLSIPIGTYLALHFFPNKKKTIPILITSVVGWSFVLSVALTAF